MYKQNSGQSNIEGSIETTGGFNIQSNLQTGVFTEMPL